MKARKKVTDFVSFMFDKSFMLDEEVWGVFKNNILLGTYIVEKPQTSKGSIMRSFLLFTRLFPLLFSLNGKALRLLNTYMQVTRAAVPTVPHHYLIMIGVQSEMQGLGIGKVLLRHLLASSLQHPHSCGVALDTENIDNVKLYERFGFTLITEVHMQVLPCILYV